MISVVVPVYNSEQYLENCIQSIISQSFRDLEVILINDGSTDRSLEICEKMSKKDDRIKVLDKMNGGQGSARNLGLTIAEGEYIMFIDSDDAIAPNTLLDNYQILQKNPDIECLQFPICRNYGTTKANIKEQKERLYDSQFDLKKMIFQQSIITWIVCDKIIRKDVLKDLHFREDIIYEDNYYLMQLIEKLDNIYISNKGLYYYYTRENSTTTSEITLKKEKSTVVVLLFILDHLQFPDHHVIFLKYLVRLINVNKSLNVNFKYTMDEVRKYRHLVNIKDVFKAPLSWKDKSKLLLYKIWG